MDVSKHKHETTNMKTMDQKGSHVIGVVLALVVIGVIGLVGYRVMSPKQTQQNTANKTAEQSNSKPVKWMYNHQKREYFVQSGTAPKCKAPFMFDRAPVDMSQVTSIGLPGSYRSSGYKPHGGLRLDNSKDGKIDIVLPVDATLVDMKRYLEGEPAELQYLLTFEMDCGIAFRFDHLLTLTPDFQKIAETTPEPKLNDSRSNPDDAPDPVRFRSGTVVATAVGFPRIKNFGFDFGVYDYRTKNDISRNSNWADIHRQHSALEWHGVCWLDLLPAADKDKAKTLSRVQINPSKPFRLISDYCKDAEYTTLDFNNGLQPPQEL